MYSTVLILPQDQVATGNAVAEAMGWGPNNYSVPLYSGAEEPTHYGLHAWTSDEFPQMLETPPPLEGISEESVQEMLAALISSFWPSHENHFETIIAEQGLTKEK